MCLRRLEIAEGMKVQAASWIDRAKMKQEVVHTKLNLVLGYARLAKRNKAAKQHVKNHVKTARGDVNLNVKNQVNAITANMTVKQTIKEDAETIVKILVKRVAKQLVNLVAKRDVNQDVKLRAKVLVKMQCKGTLRQMRQAQ